MRLVSFSAGCLYPYLGASVCHKQSAKAKLSETALGVAHHANPVSETNVIPTKSMTAECVHLGELVLDDAKAT